MKIKAEMFLLDLENMSAYELLAWLGITIIIGAIGMSLLLWMGILK